MQDLPSLPAPSLDRGHSSKQKNGFLNRLFAQRPLLATLLLALYFFISRRVFGFIIPFVFYGWHLSFIERNLLGESFSVILVIIPLTLLGWWTITGFTRGIRLQQLPLYILPFAIFVLPSLCATPLAVGKSTVSITIVTLVVSLLVGFVEEGLFRGLLLQNFLPKGIWPSVLISALLFSLFHLSNILSGFSWSYVLVQMVLAFGIGVLLAALRLRSGSIWLGVLFHAIHDFPGIIVLAINPGQASSTSSMLTLIVNGIFCLIFLVNAFVILRPRKTRELRIAYGLDPTPIPLLPLPGDVVTHS